MAQESPRPSPVSGVGGLSAWDVVHSINMGIACFIAYTAATSLLANATARDDDFLGGMWAAVATAFVFRDTRTQSLSAGVARLIATCVSFAICLPYLAFFPASSIGIAVLVTMGTLVMMLLNRREDIITTAITTIVVMVVAILSPKHAWTQPLLRLVDTAIGIGVGVACKWCASLALSGFLREGSAASSREN
jgi:uncharacterized membrane protein YgaE (UPF0421/DUF939 family)